MVFPISITIFASFLWAITNHIDKILINKLDENACSIKTLMIFSTFVAGLIFIPVLLIINKFKISISLISLVSIILSSITNISALYFYFKALEKNDTSIVVVMFQLIPVFSYILAFIFFKENLGLFQIIGSLIIILSSILISIDFENNNNKNKFKALLLMTFASLFYAIYYILFDLAIRHSSFSSCAFWFQIGLLFIGIIFLFIKNFRITFIKAIKNNGKIYLTLNTLNEILDLIADLLVNFANLTIPIALVNVLNGFQGAFVFLLGLIGIKFLPKYFYENLNRKVIIQKISCIILSIIGLIVMFM